MKILGRVTFFLLLGGIFAQSSRNAKVSGKSAKRGGGGGAQAADAGQSTPSADASQGSSRSSGRSADSRQDSAAGSRATGQQTDEMRLQLLRSAQVTCNDGSAAGFYLKEFRGSRRWLLFLEGGWCCYSKETCDSRYQNIPRLMSSSGWPQTKRGTGILSSQAEENPHWHNANLVETLDWDFFFLFLNCPCKLPNSNEYSFMGSLIIREVIKDLIPKGIKQAKVVMLAGTSAGATGVLLNIERVASQLEQLGTEAQVRGLVDSGWFLESKQQRSPDCPATVSCTPEDAIKIGLRMWNGVVPERCRQLYKRGEEWQCFFGHRLYSTLTSPLFIVQWLFDEEQLRVENIYMGGQSLSEEQWQYIQNLGLEIKNSLTDVTAVFAPSCLSHKVITKSNWMSFQVKGTSLPRALHCWDRSLEAIRNNRTPSKGCPFHLVDTCQWPQCNPTCPALVDQATQQELTLLQMLVAMGLDPQRLGLDPEGEGDSLVSMANNGG
uniref:Notum pectinacetylesterase 2 n=1 Tax=Poecilia latipinna TaxID=48699 RepID=A0A3B3TXW6_9TELE